MKKILIAIVVLLLAGVAGTGLWHTPERMLALKDAMDRSRAGLTEYSLDTESGQVRYLAGGKPDGPPLLLLHGFGTGKEQWAPAARFLTGHFRLVIPDLPGFGESDRVQTGGYGMVVQGNRMAALMTALEFERFHVAGSSMGGHIAGAMTIHHPERILSLGLFNPGGIKEPRRSEAKRIFDETGVSPLVVQNEEDYNRLLAFLFVQPPWVPESVGRFMARRALANRAFNTELMEDSKDGMWPLDEHLEEIGVETFVLWGDQDRVTDISALDVIREKLPGSRVTILKDCGHVPMLEQPAEAAGSYLTFLQDVENRL